MKPNFDIAECLARELRLSQYDNCLSLDIRKMNFSKPIIIDTFQNYSRLTGIPIENLTAREKLNDGYTIVANNIYIILYDEQILYSERLNWTLAHEVGHIYLNHSRDGSIEEVEAHWFAAELLAPEIIIRAIARQRNEIGRKLDVFDIQDLFHISYEASMKRVSSINRKCAFSSYLEKETIMKYQNHILKHGFAFNNPISTSLNQWAESRNQL